MTPHMIVKRFGCMAIHNKALYKCIIHSFIHSFIQGLILIVFGSLNTFIMTALVDLYRVMDAAILVCAESESWDLQHVNESSPPETR